MRALFLLLLLFCSFNLSAQKHDYIWITGDDNQIFNPAIGWGGSLIDFNHAPLKMAAHYRDQNMYLTNASICDTAGNLMFYTNGCVIAGADDDIMDNGEAINPGAFHDRFCDYYEDGYGGGPQNALILPWPDSTGVYVLFHKTYKLILSGTDAFCDMLLSSVVDMNLNFGRGKVVGKNLPVLNDTLSRSELAAVKHANGTDWWVVTTRKNSNVFYVIKFTKDGIVDTLQQTIGLATNLANEPISEGLGQMVFSPDGTKMYRTNRYEPIMCYSFDRENGVFTNFDTIHYDYGDQLIGEAGCAVSPSGQFLYLFCRKFLYQFDLYAPDVSASQTTVAEWDGFATPLPTIFVFGQLAPDCKIYIMSGDTRYWHVIHNPDLPYPECNLVQRGLVLPTRCGASMPSPPNYRLGPVGDEGVPCTGVYVPVAVHHPIALRREVSVSPNPAHDYLILQPDQPFQTATVTLFNSLGALVKTYALAAGETELPIADLPPGSYALQVRLDGGEVWNGVFVKM